MRNAFVIFMLSLVAGAVIAEDPNPPYQNYELTDEKLAEAVEVCPVDRGRYDTGPGLYLRDSKSDKWASGISARVYTPYSWICKEAMEAGRKFMTLTVDDVTEDMKRPVLRVRAFPGKIMGNARKHGLEEYGMTHVTIRSTAKKHFAVLEPVSVEEEPETAENIDERKNYYPTLWVLFDLEQVAEISKLDAKGEVFVVFSNSLGKERRLKIKNKHFKKLP